MKIAIISDTHGLHEQLEMPEADVLVHCGDFSHSRKSARLFLEWFSTQDYKYKVLIAGNHDRWFEKMGYDTIQQVLKDYGTDIIYLQDTEVIIEGVKFYGTPWVPQFFDWAFMGTESYLSNKFKKIPEDTQVLITHGPQYSVLDTVNENRSVGSTALRDRIKTLPNLVLHTFGHIHSGTGRVDTDYISINAANSYEYYEDTTTLKPVTLIEI